MCKYQMALTCGRVEDVVDHAGVNGLMDYNGWIGLGTMPWSCRR